MPDINRLDTLLTDPGWTEPSAIEYAKQWITTFQQECGERWIEPTSIDSQPFSNYTIHFEFFHGNRKISLYISEHDREENYADKVDDKAIEEASINTPEERSALWAWLLEDAQ